MTPQQGQPSKPFYITTPIYYVNDAPHIGHCYTTLVADVAARAQRLIRGDAGQVFLLTGTDEHADKVVTSAAAHDKTPLEWADINAARFKAAFEEMNFSHDDFIRTTEPRHTEKVTGYIQKMLDSGDIYKGDYTGWYDEGQEEYVPENEAREADYKSKISGKDLVKRTEQNYFFRLEKYAGWLEEVINSGEFRIEPEARKNEVLGRIRQGLRDVPVSRAIDANEDVWGVRMPGDAGHRVYVWIDALFNYLSTVDTNDRRKFWPPDMNLVGKDILWFHAVIWPCMLKALGEDRPACVYAHGWWVSEGRKMSKSMGNFIDLPTLRAYAERYGLDAVRWYLATQGPLGANDADFAYDKFVEVYNADLANGIGNSTSRVGNMVAKYFDGALPALAAGSAELIAPVRDAIVPAVDEFVRAFETAGYTDALRPAMALVDKVDGYIAETRPFTTAKAFGTGEATANGLSPEDEVAGILYVCAEALRIATLLMSPAMPQKMAELWANWNCAPPEGVPLAELAKFGGPCGLKPGQQIAKGEPLFMRADAKLDPPAAPA